LIADWSVEKMHPDMTSYGMLRDVSVSQKKKKDTTNT